MIELKPVIYFASPYTHGDHSVVRLRAKAIIEIVADVYNSRSPIIPFSPIALTDQYAYLELSEEEWRDLVLQYLARCDGMIVVMLPGWKDSVGIKKEIEYCSDHNIPCYYAEPTDVPLVCDSLFRELAGKDLLHGR